MANIQHHLIYTVLHLCFISTQRTMLNHTNAINYRWHWKDCVETFRMSIWL